MLKFEFFKQFHAKHGKLNFLNIINEILKWFGGQDLSVLPWGLGSNPWWMHALMYLVQMQFTNIYIN